MWQFPSLPNERQYNQYNIDAQDRLRAAHAMGESGCGVKALRRFAGIGDKESLNR
jgi:hypothetical protein